MSAIEAVPTGRTWPNEGPGRAPYWVFADPDVYEREQVRIFRGPVWHYVGLEAEMPERRRLQDDARRRRAGHRVPRRRSDGCTRWSTVARTGATSCAARNSGAPRSSTASITPGSTTSRATSSRRRSGAAFAARAGCRPISGSRITACRRSAARASAVSRSRRTRPTRRRSRNGSARSETASAGR